jgi:hypothetical protein
VYIYIGNPIHSSYSSPHASNWLDTHVSLSVWLDGFSPTSFQPIGYTCVSFCVIRWIFPSIERLGVECRKIESWDEELLERGFFNLTKKSRLRIGFGNFWKCFYSYYLVMFFFLFDERILSHAALTIYYVYGKPGFKFCFMGPSFCGSPWGLNGPIWHDGGPAPTSFAQDQINILYCML